jgi:hypothetical protein
MPFEVVSTINSMRKAAAMDGAEANIGVAGERVWAITLREPRLQPPVPSRRSQILLLRPATENVTYRAMAAGLAFQESRRSEITARLCRMQATMAPLPRGNRRKMRWRRQRRRHGPLSPSRPLRLYQAFGHRANSPDSSLCICFITQPRARSYCTYAFRGSGERRRRSRRQFRMPWRR